MTVAAVILSGTAEGAMAPTEGQPRVRRLVDIAWSGGALPVVVVSPDPDGAVVRALAGSESAHAQPAPLESGPAGQMLRGAEVAAESVHGTTAVLLWPARMAWVGPETVTSLIEAHGTDSETILRPAWDGQAGWPVLLPLAHEAVLRTIAPDRLPDEIVADLVASIPSRRIEVGDPGVILDVETDRADLPPYGGPPDPPAGHVHQWGDDVQAEAGLPSPENGG